MKTAKQVAGLVALFWGAVAQSACPPANGLAAKSAPGLCATVISSGLLMPRGLAVLEDGRLLVTEMRRWDAAHGRLIQLKQGESGWEKAVVAKDFDRPHGVLRGPDGKIYVGEAGRIVRFSLEQPEKRETVINLPIRQRHPLTNFALSDSGDLFVNVGSSSDNCEQATEKEQRAGVCPEVENADPVGVVWRYRLGTDGKVSDLGVFARGLRNSMALGVHPQSGTVLQAENSRDAIQLKLGLANDNELPHDELNVLQAGQHYGWPYCYDKRLAAPEFPAYDCRKTARPFRLLPAHAAPLGLTWWLGDRAPAQFRGWLVVGYHGYRQHGHRLVAWAVDEKGLPKGKPVELLSQWQDAKGVGGPVEVRAGADGALYLTDDRHGQVIKLYAP